MRGIDLRNIVAEKYPEFLHALPAAVRKLALRILERILRLQTVNSFLKEHGDAMNVEFIDRLFDWLGFSYRISHRDRRRIPSEGRVICIANHPLGALDSLAVVRAVREVREDVRIVANDVLLQLENLRDLFLPIDITRGTGARAHLKAIADALEREEAVVIFPAGEVSRLHWNGIRDRKWQKGAVRLAQNHRAPILPMRIEGRNSFGFYLMSWIFKPFSTLLLPSQIFKKKNSTITIHVGELIPEREFRNRLPQELTADLRRHTDGLGRIPAGTLRTEKTVVHPVDRRILKRELRNTRLLNITPDGKLIYLVRHDEAPNLMRELARMREVTFRRVGEGTRREIDLDAYDRTYQHLVLWDNEDLEIVGSYRIGVCPDLLRTGSVNALYTSSCFSLSPAFSTYLPHAIELGRSFVQQRYWNSNALEYLWHGLGAYVIDNPHIRYLFGAVSLSVEYPREAQEMIVHFYRKWFGAEPGIVTGRAPLTLQAERRAQLNALFSSTDYNAEFRLLKNWLKERGLSFPTLYRQYTDLCEAGGVKFFDFSVDRDFNNCIDGFILVDLNLLKSSKRERYLSNNKLRRTPAGSSAEQSAPTPPVPVPELVAV
jgi:putative hemolysin